MHQRVRNSFADIAPQVSKKLVRGDYKHGHVKDPTAKLDSKHERTVKKFVKDFLEKAVMKRAARDKEKAAKAAKKTKGIAEGKSKVVADSPATPKIEEEHADSDDEMLGLSDDEESKALQTSPDDSSAADLKRKREGDADLGSPKKSRTELTPAPPPPPPPPPPAEDMPPIDQDGYALDPAAIGAMAEASFGVNAGISNALVTDRVKQSEDSGKADDTASPMQLATPPTTTNGSCEHDSNGKDGGRDLPISRKDPSVQVDGES
jgi:histone-lysine N-methyltransferase SETD2